MNAKNVDIRLYDFLHGNDIYKLKNIYINYKIPSNPLESPRIPKNPQTCKYNIVKVMMPLIYLIVCSAV